MFLDASASWCHQELSPTALRWSTPILIEGKMSPQHECFPSLTLGTLFFSAQREWLYNGKLDNQNLKSIGKEQFERSRKQGTTPVINGLPPYLIIASPYLRYRFLGESISLAYLGPCVHTLVRVGQVILIKIPLALYLITKNSSPEQNQGSVPRKGKTHWAGKNNRWLTQKN